MMQPVDFEQVNKILVPAEGQDNVVSLPVHDHGNWVTSCWEVSDAELQEILRTRKVWLTVLGTTHPPLMVNGIRPKMEN